MGRHQKIQRLLLGGAIISDMTLRVDREDRLPPLIRNLNFSDKTADLPINQFQVPVGNEKGKSIVKIPLIQYL